MASTGSEDVPYPYGKSYKWPSTLYDELTQMGDISFIIYQLGYLSEASRKAKELGVQFKGMELDVNGSVIKPNIASSALKRNFTPGELKQIIQDNLEFLNELFPGYSEEPSLSATYESLDELEMVPADATLDLANSGSSVVTSNSGSTKIVKPWRAYTIEEFEDRFQQNELVYSVVKDTYHQRITLVFRGTENILGAAVTNWMSNLKIKVEETELPETIKGNIEGETTIGLHEGYHDYLFANTTDTEDAETFTKYDQIKEDVMGLVKKYPGYKLYVTGHSLGAGLSTLAAFFLASEHSIPKPVTCINFASPRVGTRSFLRACQYLEKTCQLRIVRTMNANDSIAVLPMAPYVHVGFQVTLYKDGIKAPDLHYPNLKLDWMEWAKISWKNSLIASLNLGYDHGDYRERLDLPVAKHFLEKFNLIPLYQDEEMVGFSLRPLRVRFTSDTKMGQTIDLSTALK